MKQLIERFARLSEDQLTAMTLIFAGLTVVSLFIFGALWIAPNTSAERQALAFTPTARPRATLPPTWTPTPEPTPTATATPRPVTPTASPAPLEESAPLQAVVVAEIEPPSPTAAVEASPTAEPDIAATIAAAASPTPEPTRVPPTFPPARPPAPPPPPTATPTPPYILRQMLGGSGCGGVTAFGTVYQQNGSGRQGVTIKMYNDYGYVREAVTDGSGRWEIYLRPDPDPSLAGNWHWEVTENGIAVSPQITFPMTGRCGDGPHAFQIDFQRTIP